MMLAIIGPAHVTGDGIHSFQTYTISFIKKRLLYARGLYVLMH